MSGTPAKTPTIPSAAPDTAQPSLVPTIASGNIALQISPENANSLAAISQYDFGAWDQVLAIAWSSDGSALAVSAGDAIYLLESGNLEESLRLDLGVASACLAFSPDGKHLAAGGRDGVLRVWEIPGGDPLQELQAHQKNISSLAYSPDGSKLATGGYDAVARLWDTTSYQNLGEMIGGTFAVPAIAFTPDGNSLAIVNGNVIRLRDVATQRFVLTIVGSEPFYTISVSPDGKYLASGDVANTVQIWDLEAEPGPGGEIRTSLHTLSGHQGAPNRPEALVWQVSYTPDGSLLASAGGDGDILIWDATRGELLVSLNENSHAATSAAFSPDGRWLATGGLDGKLILWSVRG